MKRLALVIMVALLSLAAVAQKQGYYLTYVVPTATTKVTEYIKPYSLVMVANDTTLYLTKVAIPVGRTITNTMKTSAANYGIINRAIFAGKASSYYVDTANAQDIYGVKTFKNNSVFGGTMGVAGNFAVNTNKFSVTASSGNTSVGGTLSAVGNVAIGTTDLNKFTVAGTTGNTLVAGTLGVTGVTTLTAGAIFTAVSDTTTKTAGKIVFIGGNFYGCDGTHYLKLNN